MESCYVLVDDLRASTDTAILLGGKVMRDITEVPDMGWFSIIQDPAGSLVGLWKTNRETMQAEHGAKEKAARGAEARAH